MTKRLPSLSAQITLLVERAQALGLAVEAVEITPQGCPRILTRRPGVGLALDGGDDWVKLAGETQDLGRA
jgi:hypothetical protein